MNGSPAPSTEQVMLQIFLQVVVAAAAPVLLTFFGMFLRQAVSWAKAKLDHEQLSTAEDIIRRLVLAAEQYDLSGIVSRVGEEKKAWVIEEASRELAKHKIYLDLNVIADIIEAAVLAELTKPKLDRAALAGDLAPKANLN
jgi:hypothetical protein